MKIKHSAVLVCVLSVLLLPQARAENNPNANAAGADAVIDRIIQNENSLAETLGQYTPVVETYIQNMEADQDLGAVPKSDKYFLGKLKLKNGINEHSFAAPSNVLESLKNTVTDLY